jgi:hypothetical protein
VICREVNVNAEKRKKATTTARLAEKRSCRAEATNNGTLIVV